MKLFKPAITLMNSLPYLGKFAIITLLFCLTFGWLAVDKILALKQDLARSIEEREANALIPKALDYYNQSLRYSNLLFINTAMQEQKIEKPIQEAENLASKKAIQFNTSASQLLPSLPPLTFFKDRKIKNMSNMSLTQIYNAYTKSEDSFPSYMRTFMSQSNLLHDEDPVIFSQVEFILNNLINYYKQVHKASGYHSYVTAYGYIETQTKAGFLSISDNLTDSINKAKNQEIRHALEAAKDIYQKNVIEKFISHGFIYDMNDRVNWNKKSLLYQPTLNKINSVLNQVTSKINQQLSKRIEKLKLHLALVFSSIIGAISLLLYLLYGFYVSVKSSIKRLMVSAEKLAEGDLSQPVNVESKDELGLLANTFEKMRMQIAQLVIKVVEITDNTAIKAEEVRGNALVSRSATNAQFQDTQVAIDSMNQLVEGVHHIARGTNKASEASNKIENETAQGIQQLKEMTEKIKILAQIINSSSDSIQKVAKETTAITQILDVINGIADRTNLLALNAAIEAARAGEQGRGFAVVADEVRGLAKKVQESTEKIEQSIHTLQHQVNDSVRFMNNTQNHMEQSTQTNAKLEESFSLITLSLRQLVDINTTIASTAEEQANEAQTVEETISNIGKSSKETNDLAQQAENNCNDLNDYTTNLKSVVAAFKAP